MNEDYEDDEDDNPEDAFDEIDIYNIEQAENLYRNVKIMADISKYKVRKPNSIEMEFFTVKEWMNWYQEMFVISGIPGPENEIINLLFQIDMEVQNTTRKIEDSLRLMLNVLHKQSIRLKRAHIEMSVLRKEIKQLHEYQSPKAVKQEDDGVELQVIEQEEKNSKQLPKWKKKSNSLDD